jgi:Fur family transcriptional regulator, ferric uptake regulator
MDDRLSEILKNNGYSVTTARQLVFSMLKSHNHPVTMNELIRKLTGKVNRASVYRVVAVFEETRVLNRVQLGWKYKLELSDKFQYHHHHLSCSVCGTIESFQETPELLVEMKKISYSLEYELQNHTLELTGVCKNCRTSISI